VEEGVNAENVCMSTQIESTHIAFDGKQIQISPNLHKVFSFLIEIEKESDAIFGVQERLEEARLYYKDLLELTGKLSKVVHDNKIDGWSHEFKKDPRTFTDVLKYHIPIRTQMIHLFTQLEVMYFLYIAYTKEIDGEIELRKVAMDDKKLRKDFMQKFLLSEENEYYVQHKKRLSKLDAGKLIRLRNTLVHFFSLSSDSIGITADQNSDDARKFETYAAEKKLDSFVILSPTDLHELIKSAYFILIKLWTNDTLRDNASFVRKIGYVNNVVSEHGAIVVYYNNKDTV
jgi:hypothetical protein